MHPEFNSYSHNELSKIYAEAQADLNTALLNGADWKEVSDKRRKVTQLSIALHKRQIHLETSPADNNTREEV